MQGYVRWQVLAIGIAISVCVYGASLLFQDTDRDTSPARVVLIKPPGTAAAPMLPPAGTVPVVQTAAGAGHRQPGKGEAEVCGLGIVNTSAEDPDGSGHIPVALRSSAEQAGVTALAASQDQRAEAVALLLQARAAARAGGSGDAQMEQLAQMAERSSDAAVYAMALQACEAYGAKGPAACAGLNASQWARLEPDNAAAWLKLAQEAQASGDQAALAEAIYRVSLTSRINWHANDAAVVALQGLSRTVAPLEQAVMTHEASQIENSWPSPSYAGLTAYCAADDVNRAQQCDAAARLLERSGGSPAELRIAMRVGQTLGWDAQRLENLRLQRDVLSDAIAGAGFPEQAYSCASVAQLQSWMAREHDAGELGAARAVLQSRGDDLHARMATLKHHREERRKAIQ